MADLEEEDFPEGEDLASRVILQGGEVKTDYNVGRICLANETDFASIILIALVENSFVVALPKSVWHKRVAKRLLHVQGLLKPLACTVKGFPPGSYEDEELAVQVPMWIGLLAGELEQLVDFENSDVTHLFCGANGEPLYPVAQGLVDVAKDHFTFLTAESGGDGGGSAGMARIDKLEAMMLEMSADVQKLLKREARPPALRVPAAPAPSHLPSAQYEGLDPKVVQAARTAGIPEAHLAEMAQIVKRQPRRMEDLPRSGAKPSGGGLSESDDEESDVEGNTTSPVPADGGVAQAIVKLTKVCTVLAKDKKGRGKDLVEQILDGPGQGGGGDGSGLGSSRKNAAALRALKRALVEKPEYLYETIESLLQSDFEARPARPGQPLGGASIRGWLESRSRIQNYTSHVRWTWAVAGIWDCLVRDDVKQARARAALLVAAADQAAIDGGSWLLGSVALLEAPAPYHAFSHHQPPSAQDLQHSALLDPRWMEVFLAHVKELDSYQEAKKRLNKPSSSSSPQATAEPAKPKAKPKPKAKGKGAQKGKESEGAPEEGGS